MPSRLQCSCGLWLNVPDSAAGKKVRCPRCQTLTQVPVVVEAIQPQATPNIFDNLPPLDPVQAPLPKASSYSMPDVSRQWSAPKRIAPKRKAKPSADGRRLTIVAGIMAAVATGLFGLGGVAIWLLAPVFLGDGGVAAQFTPLASTASPNAATGDSTVSPGRSAAPLVGRNAHETAMLKVAEQFMQHARQNEHSEAVQMIDPKLFHTRLIGPKGSYEAMTKDISAAELLKNYGRYAVDGAPQGGRRHWQVLGVSRFDGHPGVVLRYYVEPEPALKVLTAPKLFDRLGALVTYEQISQQASHLFTSDGQKGSLLDHGSYGSHAIHNVFPERAGLMMLVFDLDPTAARLVDLVNVLGQAPLSRTGAHVFMDDYHIFGGYGTRETHGTKPCSVSIYGVSDVTDGASWTANDEAAKERALKKAEADTEAVEQLRPKRLQKLVQLWANSDSSFSTELAAFRSDFGRDDLGFELAIVLYKMASPQPVFTAADEALIVPATQALYEQWNDPFFLYVAGLCAQQNGRQADADELFSRSKGAGFAPAQLFATQLELAVDRGDSSAALKILEEWSRAVEAPGFSPTQDQLDTLARRYEQLDRALNPQPTVREQMAGGRRGPARDRFLGAGTTDDPSGAGQPFLGPRFGLDNSSSSPQASSPSGAAGSQGAPWSQGGTRPGRPGQQGAPSRQVIIKVTSAQGFDGNAIMQSLAARLETKNYNFSQVNQTATLNLSFDGTLQTVVDLIDFGSVTSTDESTRTINVSIP